MDGTSTDQRSFNHSGITSTMDSNTNAIQGDLFLQARWRCTRYSIPASCAFRVKGSEESVDPSIFTAQGRFNLVAWHTPGNPLAIQRHPKLDDKIKGLIEVMPQSFLCHAARGPGPGLSATLWKHSRQQSQLCVEIVY
eukprot:symbB.v1.2.003122.t1/scaffold151.1/size297192/21